MDTAPDRNGDAAPGPIVLDLEETAAHIKKLREHADALERHGDVHPSILQALDALGDIHQPYVEAKKQEVHARMAAYQRLADGVRQHADKLEGTATAFSAQDDASAAALRAIDV